MHLQNLITIAINNSQIFLYIFLKLSIVKNQPAKRVRTFLSNLIMIKQTENNFILLYITVKMLKQLCMELYTNI